MTSLTPEARAALVARLRAAQWFHSAEDECREAADEITALAVRVEALEAGHMQIINEFDVTPNGHRAVTIARDALAKAKALNDKGA